MNKPIYQQKALCLYAALSLAALTTPTAHAQVRTWDGGGTIDVTDFNEAANWSADTIPVAGTTATLTGGGLGETVLSGGNINAAFAFNLRNGHLLTVDNDGGSLTVARNFNFGRGVATTELSVFNLLAGDVTLGGFDMGGNSTGGPSAFTISGGSLSVGGFDTLDVGGEFETTFAIEGDSATVTVTNNRGVLARDTSIFSFTLGATGVDDIDTGGAFNLEPGAELIIDGSSYTGGAGTIPLFSYGSRTDATAEFIENISGFAGFQTDVIYSDNGVSLSVFVSGAPLVTSFTADTTQDPVILSWTTVNATTLTLDPGGNNVTGNTTFSLPAPTTTTVYTLTASDGVTSDSATLEIVVTPEIVFFDAGIGSTSPTQIALGDDVTLEWEAASFTALTLRPDGDPTGDIDVTSLTERLLSPTATTTYTLIAANGATTVESEFTIIVGPTVTSFVASPSVVTSGDDSTLSWTVEEFSTLTLDQGIGDVSTLSSIPITDLTVTTSYTLTATDSAGNITTATVTVGVIPPNPPAPSGPTISVNFHAEDANALLDHQLEAGEIAGFVPVDGVFWTNINVGAPAGHGLEPLFPSTALSDDTGNTIAATIAPSVDSTYFVGHAASTAAIASELGLPGNDDDLFNSYLALNGPSGDGTPADAAVLNISGLGADYTSGGYTLIIYSDSDRLPGGTAVRQSLYTVTQAGGSPRTAFVEDDGASTLTNTFDGTYIFGDGVDDGPDYANFTIIEGLSASSFTLEVTSPDGGRGAINGFQIVGGTGIISDASPLTLCIENAANGTDLDFTWDSLPGMSYNLRASSILDASSDPATWPIVGTSTSNSLSLTRPGDLRTFYIIEEFPTP